MLKTDIFIKRILHEKDYELQITHIFNSDSKEQLDQIEEFMKRYKEGMPNDTTAK